MDEYIYNKLVNLKDNNNISNILLYGDNLSGKKTILEKFLKYVYKNQKNIDKYVIILNCSHGKGNIKFIRETIKYFSNTVINKNDQVDFKMIILLNADKLTYDAQSALRRCIEIYNASTRFFIIMDDKNKLMKPILSRFSHIYINNNLHDIDNNLKKHYNSVYNKMKKILNQFNSNLDISNNYIDIIKITNKLYISGISCDMLLKLLSKNQDDSLNKLKFLLYFDKKKVQIRNEELLIFLVLTYYYNNYSVFIDK